MSQEYIKAECLENYEKEKNNLANILIGAQYNLKFLQLAIQQSELYSQNHDVCERLEMRSILKRIHITVANTLILQIKQFADDNKPDTMTISKFKNNIFGYIKEEKKQELYEQVGLIIKTVEWKNCQGVISKLSVFRNEILAHNLMDYPYMEVDINEVSLVVSEYDKLFRILSFQDSEYLERSEDIDKCTTDFMKIFFDTLLPLN